MWPRERGLRTLLDSELFLPKESWSQDRTRCRKTGIPESMVLRTKAKEAEFYLRKGDKYIAVPSIAHRLITARNVLSGETDLFVSNAPLSVPLGTLLRVDFTRLTVERCFQDTKEELGMGHFEVRNYKSLMRHMILTAVSFLFLDRARQKCWGGGGATFASDDLPVTAGHKRAHQGTLGELIGVA